MAIANIRGYIGPALETKIVEVDNVSLRVTLTPVYLSKSEMRPTGHFCEFTRYDTQQKWSCLIDSRVKICRKGHMAIIGIESGRIVIVQDKSRNDHLPLDLVLNRS